ncbi:hypothetical protein LCGC14_0387270 [marine sediment metagenome]|uniref:BppU N-terminal domain-containing protein n=1 Tax=marine sediment metagenome TaxID=412755 RepID=A0A0F9T6L7_9ZZZZ
MATLQKEIRFAGEDTTITIALVDENGDALSGDDVDNITIYTYSVATNVHATAEFSKGIGTGVTLSNSAITATVVIADTDTDDLDGVYYHEAKYVLSGAETVNMTGFIIFRAGLI